MMNESFGRSMTLTLIVTFKEPLVRFSHQDALLRVDASTFLPRAVDVWRSRPLDELSLQSFEIAGGEPAQDEFLSLGHLNRSAQHFCGSGVSVLELVVDLILRGTCVL